MFQRTSWGWGDADINAYRFCRSAFRFFEIRRSYVDDSSRNKSYIGANLRGVNLMYADLSQANLRQADLSEATLKKAWLESANLTEVQAIATNFTGAKLTGACLEKKNARNIRLLFYPNRETETGSQF